MAKLHRHPRRSRNRPPELRRQDRKDQRRSVYIRRNGCYGVRLVHVPLAREEH